jgi:hypothetical protein
VDELAHGRTINADYGFDVVLLEYMTWDEISHTELFACFRLHVNSVRIWVCILIVIVFSEGSAIDNDLGCQARTVRRWCHKELQPCSEVSSARRK